ncbi:MAG: ABC transporter ATP-binding protein [Armatimonadota bacterium]
MIRLESVSCHFSVPGSPPVAALQALDLTLTAGEFVTVIGTNGSGKSTLLNVLAGRVTPAAGAVWLDDRYVTRTPEHVRAAWIGRVFQNPFQGSCPNMTVEENLRLADRRGRRQALPGRGGGGRRARFREELASLELGLEDRLHALVGSLSGGQRQALTLLMATLRPPRLLLLDEHTAALDPRAATRVLELTRERVAAHQLTTLMVTHSMTQALSVGSRTIMLHHGTVIADLLGVERATARPEELVDRFTRLQLADPAP